MAENAKVYRVFGLRRSGNHAFIKWLMAQHSGRVAFYNNVDLDAVEMRPPDLSTTTGGAVQVKIYSFEDRNLKIAAKPQWLGRSVFVDCDVVDFVVLRQAPNLFASRIKAGMTTLLFLSGFTIPELTFQYFDMCDRPHEWRHRFGARLVPVVFDDFVASTDYRRQIASVAGLGECRDRVLKEVDTRYGHGSSFAPNSKQAPSPAELANRWKLVKTDKQFRSWLGEFLSLTKTHAPSLCSVDIEEWQAQGIIESGSCARFMRWIRIKCIAEVIALLRTSHIVTLLRTVAGDRRNHPILPRPANR